MVNLHWWQILQVTSLTEKLQINKAAAPTAAAGITGTKAGDHAASATDLASLAVQKKAEDRLSTGSGGSAVVDAEGPTHLLDSGEVSFFPEGYHGDVNDAANCDCYYDSMFVAEHHHHHHYHQHQEDAQLGLIKCDSFSSHSCRTETVGWHVRSFANFGIGIGREEKGGKKVAHGAGGVAADDYNGSSPTRLS
ncbi:hypothetical protein BHM03_00017795, partial [Ensete ventricosum]